MLLESGINPETAKGIAEDISRYEPFVSACSCMIFLPGMFVDLDTEVRETKFATELSTRRSSVGYRAARKVLPASQRILTRTVKCLHSWSALGGKSSNKRSVDPPNLVQQVEGRWELLEPDEVGRDVQNNPIVGRTWVKRAESWSSSSLGAFVLAPPPENMPGSREGYVYVVRSPAHSVDVYKVGMTRASPSARADKLSSTTSSALPFEVLASWRCEDPKSVEERVHKKLAPFRINNSREFFRVDLAEIVRVVSEEVFLGNSV